MTQTMKIALHAPLALASNRADVIVNAFGVKIAETVSVDHAMPIIRAVNAHDAMLAALKAARAASGQPLYLRADVIEAMDAAIAIAEG
ncbi:hypothetical protein [uncultured Alsobacter sp.]|uniref:hypothetical protein n=1 Tax=uncultured Alsobacter sp. TaxID=1748258 RepID=UPI0025D61F6A|nr:hypothetical protein [uncultured Alsobacter sp.]